MTLPILCHDIDDDSSTAAIFRKIVLFYLNPGNASECQRQSQPWDLCGAYDEEKTASQSGQRIPSSSDVVSSCSR